MHSTAQLAAIPNPYHPRFGDTFKVEPIRTVNGAINQNQHLAPFSRTFGLFHVGINTAYRASDLLSIRIGQVRHLQSGDRLDAKQRESKLYCAVKTYINLEL